MSAPRGWSESFARHLMVHIDAWQEHGFAAVAKEYLARLAPEKGAAPRHRRERRSAGAAHGQGRSRAAQARAGARRRRRGSIRRPEGRGETAAHHPARSVRHVRVRARGRARRMGGVRRLRVLPTTIPTSSKARRARRSAAAFSASQSLGWSTLVQIVEASEDDRLAAIDTLAKQLVAHFGAPDHRRCGRGGGGGIRVRRLALQSSARHADRRASLARGRRNPRDVPHLAAQGRAEAAARLLLPRSRGRGGAGGKGRSGGAGEARKGE